MKRCPKCSRTYSTETQKFCTHDGSPLVTAESGQGETIRIDASKLEQIDNAPTQAISRDLHSPTTGQFDPYRTVVGSTEQKPAPPATDPFSTVAGWREEPAKTGGRDTQELVSPVATSTSLPHSTATSVPSSPAPPKETSPPVVDGSETIPETQSEPPQAAPSSASAPLSQPPADVSSGTWIEPPTEQSAAAPPAPAIPSASLTEPTPTVTAPSAPPPQAPSAPSSGTLNEPQPAARPSAPLPPGPGTIQSVDLSETQTPSPSAPLPAGPATLPSMPLSETQLPRGESAAPSPGPMTLPAVPLITPTGAGVPSAPLIAPQPALAGSPQAMQRAPKKSKLPLILGILAVLLVILVGGIAAAYFLLLKPQLEKRPVTTQRQPTPQPTVQATPNEQGTPTDIGTNINVPPPYSPPADAVQFVNTKKNLDGKLAEHYVDFSFYYRNDWKKDPTAGVPGASNFVKVERRLPPDFTQENFAVGWYSSAGSADADASVFHTLVENLSSQFKKSFPEYEKVSEGETKVGVYHGYEFRFQSVSRNTVNGDVHVWGRVVLLPPTNGGHNGVTLLMLATSLAPELKSVDDVGEKGELPMLLQSFRFGKE